jgi:hypothetical protein
LLLSFSYENNLCLIILFSSRSVFNKSYIYDYVLFVSKWLCWKLFFIYKSIFSLSSNTLNLSSEGNWIFFSLCLFYSHNSSLIVISRLIWWQLEAIQPDDIENKIIVCNNTINDEKENNKKLNISLSELNKELVESKKQNNIRKKTISQ